MTSYYQYLLLFFHLLWMIWVDEIFRLEFLKIWNLYLFSHLLLILQPCKEIYLCIVFFNFNNSTWIQVILKKIFRLSSQDTWCSNLYLLFEIKFYLPELCYSSPPVFFFCCSCWIFSDHSLIQIRSLLVQGSLWLNKGTDTHFNVHNSGVSEVW